MGAGSIVILTSLAWMFLWYLVGIPAYRRGYKEGYFNGWKDKQEGEKYNSDKRK